MHTPQQLAAAWHRHAAAIKRQAYAFEPAPLSGLGMSAKRARGPAGHMMAQSRCDMHAGLPKARRQQKQKQRRPAAFGRMSPAIIAEPLLNFPRLILSSAFLPCAPLSPAPHRHKSWQRSRLQLARQPPFLSLAQAIDVRAMNGHSGKQTWIRREKGTGGEDHPPGRAGHGMDGKREDGDEARRRL
ncbi:hypothetical protein PVAP13_7KG304200 [Panicum virgatum]|uniref:Uncharacterized protein n=1 Tax=Panicum virgatum TaxID=38727 RepID=A0A8T0QMC7_PANVG|nr:hypothetical protein PVAP13_7KG304200 [Panicum virgatum]